MRVGCERAQMVVENGSVTTDCRLHEHPCDRLVVALAEGLIPKDLLQRVVMSLIEEDDFSDALKLDLLEAMGQRYMTDKEDEDY